MAILLHRPHLQATMGTHIGWMNYMIVAKLKLHKSQNADAVKPRSITVATLSHFVMICDFIQIRNLQQSLTVPMMCLYLSHHPPIGCLTAGFLHPFSITQTLPWMSHNRVTVQLSTNVTKMVLASSPWELPWWCTKEGTSMEMRTSASFLLQLQVSSKSSVFCHKFKSISFGAICQNNKGIFRHFTSAYHIWFNGRLSDPWWQQTLGPFC